MATLNFPQNPNPGDTYSIGSRTWVWNGSAWVLQSGIISTNPFIVVSAQVTTTTNSTSTNSGAIIVAGGGGFGGDIWAKTIYSNGAEVITTSSVGNFGVSAIQAGTDTAVASLVGNVALVWNTSTLQTVTSRGATTTNAISIANTTQSSSTVTGALRVVGGVGIGGNVYASEIYDVGRRVLTSITPVAGNSISISSVTTGSGTTSFTINNEGVTSITGTPALGVSTSTGSVTLTNLGVTSAVGTTYLGVSASTGSVTFTNLGVQTLTAGTDTAVSGSTGTITVWNNSTLQTVTGRGATTNQIIRVTNATGASTTTDGALVVTGGVGIGQNLWVGGTANVVGRATFSSEVVFNGTATFVLSTNTVYTDNILDLHTSPTNSPWEFDTGKDIGLRFNYYNRALATGTSAALVLTNDAQILEWYGTGVEGTNVFSGNYGTFRTGDIRLTSTQATAQNTTTGALQVAGGVSIRANAYILGTGAIASSTATAQQSLVVAANGIGVNGDSYFTNRVGVGGTLVAASAQVTNSFTVTGATTLGGNVTANSNLGITGGLTVTGISTFSGQTIITTGTNSAGTNSGALVVEGGVGVGGNLNVGGNIFVQGVINATVVGSISTATNLTAGSAGAIPYQTGFGQTSFINPGTSGDLLVSRGTGQPVFVNTLTLAGTVDAISTLTGTLQVRGGAGIGRDLWVGGDVYTNGQQVITTATVNNFANQTFLFAGTDTAVSTSTGNITVWNISTLQSVTNRGATTNNAILLTNSSESTGSGSGALQVSGGVSVDKNLFVGGNATFNGTSTVISNSTITTLTVNGSGTSLRVSSNAQFTGVTTATQLVVTDAFTATGIVSISTITGNTNVTGNVTAGSLSVTGTSVLSETTVSNGLKVLGTSTLASPVLIGPVAEYISFVSPTTNTNDVIYLDSYPVSGYQTAKYLVQIEDRGYTPHKIHVEEMLVFHDDNGTSTQVYQTSYAIASNDGELGDFDVVHSNGNVQLTFTPSYTPIQLLVKTVRTAIMS